MPHRLLQLGEVVALVEAREPFLPLHLPREGVPRFSLLVKQGNPTPLGFTLCDTPGVTSFSGPPSSLRNTEVWHGVRLRKRAALAVVIVVAVVDG